MLRINRKRFLSWMDEQAAIGATPEGGLSRPALSEADVEVRQWFKQMVEAHGLEYRIDGAGNQSAVLPSESHAAKTLLIGSHLDSVINGGRFDGPLGVLSALEAAVTLKESGRQLPFHLEVINFTDEEGALLGLMGSSALAGRLTREALASPRGGRETVLAGFERLGLTDDSVLAAARDPQTLYGYIEVHIEQGTRLEESGLHTGVVTSIVGIRSAWLTFKGEAAHAGTQPMNRRRDAFWGAADFVRQAREMVIRDYVPGVVNFGAAHVQPGAFNIVPAEVKLAMEFRHGTITRFDAMENALFELAEATAADFDLDVEVEKLHDIKPAPMSQAFIAAVERAADGLNLTHTRLMSFAGHDAQSLAAVTNSVMIFVPSVDGISHNPAELTHPDDCVNAANLLLHSVLTLAEGDHGT